MPGVHLVQSLGKRVMAALAAIAMLGALTSVAAGGPATMLNVRIENILQGNVLKLSSGGDAPLVLSPGVWLVHTGSGHLFKSPGEGGVRGREGQAGHRRGPYLHRQGTHRGVLSTRCSRSHQGRPAADTRPSVALWPVGGDDLAVERDTSDHQGEEQGSEEDP
jgi:hypothetical protein